MLRISQLLIVNYQFFLNPIPSIYHFPPHHRAKDYLDIHVTIKQAKTAIKILIRVPASTYSVLVVSFSPNLMIDFAAYPIILR